MNDEMTKWLESEFRSMGLQLTSIKEQTSKTEMKTNEIDKSMQEMVLSLTKHVSDCPTRTEFDEVRKELSELVFIKKYYKVFVVAGIFFFGSIVYVKYDTNDQLRDQNKKIELNVAKDDNRSKAIDLNKDAINRQGVEDAFEKSLEEWK